MREGGNKGHSWHEGLCRGGTAGTAEWTGLDLELPSRAVQIHSDTHRHNVDHLTTAKSLELPGQTDQGSNTIPSIQPGITEWTDRKRDRQADGKTDRQKDGWMD